MFRSKIDEAKRQKMILYTRVFNTREGREVLRDLMNDNFFLKPTKGDSIAEGRREALLDIIALANVPLAEIDQMLKPEGERNDVAFR